ncbi:MAG: helix-turn-helix domain-containing protein [Brevundimonas sp.]
MADGTHLIPASLTVAAPRLLFPIEPEPYETLLGFVVRCVERNRLGTPVAFMRAVGLALKAKGDFLNRLQVELPSLAPALSTSVETLEGLWGAQPPTDDRKRRLGGVWLRPALVEQSRRRAPPSIDAGEADDARWMIRPIAFCSTRWEVLIDRCPHRWCGKPLTWPRADSLHLCRHCGTPLNMALRQTIPRPHRRWLQWVMALFSEDAVQRQAAMRQVPTVFQVETETEVFELVLAIRHAFKVSGAEPGEDTNDVLEDEGSKGDWRHWVAAVRFLLEYPRSHWDLLQKRESDARAAFHHAFRRIAHNSNVPIVRSELTRLNLEAGYLPTSALGRGSQHAPEMTAAAAADALGVTPGALKQLVEAKMLAPLRTRGARHTIKFYAEEDIEALKALRGQGISGRWFRAASALPAIAIEQLVALGHLEFCRDPVAALLYGEHQLRADMADQMLERILGLPLPSTADGWIALPDALMGVGGREKPWGPVLAAGLNGCLPGGLTNGAVLGTPVFMISTAVANSLVMGGPSASPWLSFEPDHYGDLRRDWFSPGETVSYLNCSAVEISYLIDKGRLHPLAREGLTRFARTEVEEFGRVWMNTREAAARLGVTPHRVWRELEPYRLEWSLGRGFHKRDELEPIVEREVQERRLQAFGPGPTLRSKAVEEATEHASR